MRSLLRIFYFLLILLIISLLAGIFLPKEAHVETGINIRSTPEIVFNQVNNIHNWENWSPWLEADSAMIPEYNNIPKGEGASYSWESENSGSGYLRISKSEPLSQVVALIDFGVNGKSTIKFDLEKQGQITHLKWSYDNNELKYFERYFMILFKKDMIVSMNKGMRSIKDISEELQIDRISGITLLDIVPKYAMCIKDSTLTDSVRTRMAKLYPKLASYLALRKIQYTDSAFTIFYDNSSSDNKIKFACCYPIQNRTWGWREFSVIELPGGKAASISHWGILDFSKSVKAVEQYFIENNLTKSDIMWEVIKIDSATESDTSRWETQIFFPVK
jgi:effector-binding domain-containing protein